MDKPKRKTPQILITTALRGDQWEWLLREVKLTGENRMQVMRRLIDLAMREAR